jgi:hypothetical protein
MTAAVTAAEQHSVYHVAGHVNQFNVQPCTPANCTVQHSQGDGQACALGKHTGQTAAAGMTVSRISALRSTCRMVVCWQ